MNRHAVNDNLEPISLSTEAKTSSTKQPKFVTGSTMSHVIKMTVTGSIGLIAIFSVDLLTLLYISMLKVDAFTAGVGYSSLMNFFSISINIGLMIGSSALVARFIGAGDRVKAKIMASSSLGWAMIISSCVAIILLIFSSSILTLLGATGRTHEVAHSILLITLPSGPLMALGMCLSGLLRADGDANRAMYVTLAGGIATAIFDPILIFGFDLGVTGAAITIVISRIVFVVIGWHGCYRVHDLAGIPKISTMRQDAKPLFKIAFPAVLTNIATPVANAFLLRIISQFGEQAVAASAIIDRLTPVAFGVLFALSGAIGPILSQNLGAKQFDRVRKSLRDGLIIVAVYVAFTWGILSLANGLIITMFHADGATAEYVRFFCFISGIMWIFNGFLFTANAAFNNLGFPIYSTVFNWLRATVGVVPLGFLGAYMGGFQGSMIGVSLGGLIFGTAAVLVAFWQIQKIEVMSSSP
jgi:putative MATE family efflux protein